MTPEITPEIRKSLEVQAILNSYLELGKNFENPPEVELKLHSQTPDGEEDVTLRDVVVTTAVQCYAPGSAKMKSRVDEKSNAIAQSTLAAGHHTTRMHTSFTWHLRGVSRHLTHDIFHDNPFYNSEQQSQRYVEAKKGNYLVPANLTTEQRTFFLEAADYANNVYSKLLEILRPEVERRIRQMYPTGGWNVESTKSRLENKVGKICQEIARYALPISQKTTYYHTLSELQLLRLFRASRLSNMNDESRFVIARMITEVAKVDPTIYQELDLPVEPLGMPATSSSDILKQKSFFDAKLEGQNSILLNMTQGADEILIQSARLVFGLPEESISDEQVLALLLDPKNNLLLADVYDVGMMDPLTQSLRQVNVTFMTKLSHTADSQRQRHRRTPGVTPPIQATYDGKADYITPLIIKENSEIKEVYDHIMTQIYQNVDQAIAMGVPIEHAVTLLPNAHTLRIIESGDLFDWAHRLKQRLCLLAQEEIFFVSVDQAEKITERLPHAGQLLMAPCGTRKHAGIRPRCPEGDRWCGQPVFQWQLDKYKEARLI